MSIGNNMASMLADLPAFPRPVSRTERDGAQFLVLPQAGMTYRQWLVGMALQGTLANTETLTALASTASRRGFPFATAIALSVIEQADKVITELEKTNP